MSNQEKFSGKWETKRFEKLFRRLNGNFHKIQASEYSVNGLHPVIDQGQDAIVGYSDQTEKLFKCPPDGVIVFGDHTRIFKFVDVDFLIGADGTQLLAMKKDDMTKFFYYQLLTKDIPNTGYNRHFKFLKELTFKTPKLDEQRAIAEVLSDVDGLINALEALIAKKRAIKQATMQQLLTGKTRLPGFSEAWETKRIGDLLSYKRPDAYIVKSTEYSEHGNIPVLTANKAFILGYTDEVFGICQSLPVIVFDDFTTDNKYAAFPFKVKSSAIKLLYPKHERVSLRFVFERMQLIDFPLGNHKRYYISEYQNLELPVPDYEEQRAIAIVLSDMDAEIAALEQRRDKTIAIKQGMMQQLLTGRVRLFESRICTDDAD